jgi:hypothetical protein
MRLTRRSVVCAASAVLATQPAWAQDVPAPAPRFLFIGNSHTFVNDVPRMLRAVFAGVETRIETEMQTEGGFSLEDHWNARTARRQIEAGGWTMVVLQQGPSSLDSSRANLREYAGRFAELIRANGARPALYSVWPTRDRLQDYDRAAESYALAAADVGGVLFPVAKAWSAAMRANPAIELYGSDGQHASAYGSYLAALVMFAVLTRQTPVGLSNVLTFDDGQRARVPDETAAILQAAAAEAVAA